MRAPRALAISCLFVCLFGSVAAVGQEKQEGINSRASCQEFVAKFYTWYLNMPVNKKQVRKSDLALKARPYLFGDELLRQLQKDSTAQDKAGSDLVSLDADPFFGADGAAERYVVKKVRLKNGQCWAEVHGVWGGDESVTPSVTPQLVLKNHRWVFLNFYFPTPTAPNGWNVLDELKASRKLQQKYETGKNK